MDIGVPATCKGKLKPSGSCLCLSSLWRQRWKQEAKAAWGDPQPGNGWQENEGLVEIFSTLRVAGPSVHTWAALGEQEIHLEGFCLLPKLSFEEAQSHTLSFTQLPFPWTSWSLAGSACAGCSITLAQLWAQLWALQEPKPTAAAPGTIQGLSQSPCSAL